MLLLTSVFSLARFDFLFVNCDACSRFHGQVRHIVNNTDEENQAFDSVADLFGFLRLVLHERSRGNLDFDYSSSYPADNRAQRRLRQAILEVE